MLITALTNKLIPKENAQFIQEHYLPELEKSVSGITLTADEKVDLVKKFAGMLMKIAYAFLFQEYFIPLPFLYGDTVLGYAAEFMPTWNSWAVKLSGYVQTDDDVKNGTNLYPGQAQCKTHSPHALWHEESANGLLEIALVGDTVHRLTKPKN